VHLLLRDYERHGIVIVCEGEFDSIILNQNSFLAVTGTAGAGTWKPEWNAFFKGKNVVLCYDSDVAGRAGALNLLNELQGTASSIKNIDLFGSEATKDMKDVTDFFVKAQKTAKDFRLMIDSANPSAMPTPNTPNSHPILEDNSVERLRQDIVNLSGETQSESRLNNLAEKSYELLTQLGAFIRDRNGEVFYYSRFRHRIFKLQTQLFEDLVSTETSANQASTGFRYILALASVRARETAQAALISRYTHYDKDKAILYLGNHPEYYLRITPTEITTVPNGTDQLYFSMDWRFDSFEYDPTVAAGGESFAHEVLVDSISFDDGDNSILNREEQATLYWHCILALHFLTASRTKPPLTFLGEPGSGKTTALRILGTALFGPRFEVMSPSSDERDIVAAITRQPFAVLDNVDTRSKFLEDLIARVATGISYTRRKLYSDNDEIEIIPRAQLGLTSMQPYFDREDVADRLIIFRLQRHECISFRDEGSIVSDVLAKRSVILSGIIHALQRALKNIEQNKERVKLTRFRMADAALLMTRMSDEPETMMSLIAKMQDEQTKFLAEGHPLTEIICQWVRDNPQCSGIFFTTADLFSELNTYAQSKRLVFFHRSVKSLGMAISNQMRALQTRLIVTKDPSKTGNVKRYSFTLIRN
jgi:5S rRNA maturation endonuclease (ribonuclease M5)